MNYYNEFERECIEYYQFEYPEREIIYHRPVCRYPIKNSNLNSDFRAQQNYYFEYEYEVETNGHRIKEEIESLNESDYESEEKPIKCPALIKTSLRKKPKRKLKKPDYTKLVKKSSKSDKQISDTSTNNNMTDEKLNKNDKLPIDKQTQIENLNDSNTKFLVKKEISSPIETMRPKVTEESYSLSTQEPKNTRFHSVTNVKSFAEGNTTSAEMIGWRNHSMHDTTTDSANGFSFGSTDPKHLYETISSDCCTNVTINSDEYREFINQINKIPQMADKDGYYNDNNNKILRSESAPPIGIGSILKSFYDSTNSSRTPNNVDEESKKKNKSFVERKNVKQISIVNRVKEHNNIKVNPLNEVPLLYIFEWMIPKRNLDSKFKCKRPEMKNHSILFKIIRIVVQFIGKVQMFTYQYALRYLLFI